MKFETFYGPLQVEEPTLLELLASPAIERLKMVRQAGVAFYTSHKGKFSRYDHSLGILAILRLKGRPLNEQIAGLLHDVSHTAFSHAGDFIFNHTSHESSYQDTIHKAYLDHFKLPHFDADFPALEQPLPNVCADRLDYNLQAAFHEKLISQKEAQAILSSLEFTGDRWTCHDVEKMLKLGNLSLELTRTFWGSPDNYFESLWFSEAVKEAFRIHLLTKDDLLFGTDEVIWQKLNASSNPLIQQKLTQVLHSKDYFSIDENSSFKIYPKFRGLDPWVGEKRLTEVSSDYKRRFDKLKNEMSKGYPISGN